jgi:hypothetical protein
MPWCEQLLSSFEFFTFSKNGFCIYFKILFGYQDLVGWTFLLPSTNQTRIASIHPSIITIAKTSLERNLKPCLCIMEQVDPSWEGHLGPRIWGNGFQFTTIEANIWSIVTSVPASPFCQPSLWNAHISPVKGEFNSRTFLDFCERTVERRSYNDGAVAWKGPNVDYSNFLKILFRLLSFLGHSTTRLFCCD